MADLKKLLVHVPSNLCDGFKTKYVNGPEETRNKSYDGKIVFLEKTQEIFAKGKIYSTSVIDFSSLQQLVSSLQGLVGDELPEGVTSTNIIDYIGEVKKELIGKGSDDLTKDTIYGAKDYGIKAAHETKLELIGLDSDKIPEAKTIYGAYNSAISYLIGSYSDSSSYETIYGAKAYAIESVKELAPAVKAADTSITVTYNISSSGKVTYTVSTDALRSIEVLGYTLDSGHLHLPVEEAKEALGLGTAAYKSEEYFIGYMNDSDDKKLYTVLKLTH